MKQDRILLAHGSGGRKQQALIRDIFAKKFSNPILNDFDDAAEIDGLAFTTDSYVVKPLFFPGGDIGKLAVCGTVNDLAMKGAKPLYLSASAIIEEGFEIDKLERIVESMAKACTSAGVIIVTGDTKVVEKGGADGIFITTSGIGQILPKVNISSKNAKVGDAVIISGSVAEHGIAVMNERNSLGFSGDIKSDVAPLNKIVEKILGKYPQVVHVMRDPTRGGVASALNEIAEMSKVGILVDENKIPIKPLIKEACDLLGLDPLHVANEGKFVAFVNPKYSKQTLKMMGKDAKIIGFVTKKFKGVRLKTSIGGERILSMLEGEQLPRIC